jgi:hypothetical protein
MGIPERLCRNFQPIAIYLSGRVLYVIGGNFVLPLCFGPLKAIIVGNRRSELLVRLWFLSVDECPKCP